MELSLNCVNRSKSRIETVQNWGQRMRGLVIEKFGILTGKRQNDNCLALGMSNCFWLTTRNSGNWNIMMSTQRFPEIIKTSDKIRTDHRPPDAPVYFPINNHRPHYATFNPNEIMSSNETKLRANRLINGSIILSLIDRQFSTRWKLIAKPQEVFVPLSERFVESSLEKFTWLQMNKKHLISFFPQITRSAIDDSRICVTCASEFIMKTFGNGIRNTLREC